MFRCRQILLALAALPWLHPSSANASSSLAALTIRLSDLRPGYVVSAARPRTRPGVASREYVGGHVLLSHGWTDGYDVLYQRRENAGIQVGETADRFSTDVGAHWWYGVSLLRVPSGYRTTAMPRVGDESTAVRSRAYVGIIFSRGRYVMDVYVSISVPSPPSAVLALARLVDRRLERDEAYAATSKLLRSRQRVLLRAWVTPNPMPYDAYPVLHAKTVSGARCFASLVYSTGYRPHSFDGHTRLVGRSGVVGWSWHELMSGSHGTGTVTCTYRGQKSHATATFAVRS